MIGLVSAFVSRSPRLFDHFSHYYLPSISGLVKEQALLNDPPPFDHFLLYITTDMADEIKPVQPVSLFGKFPSARVDHLIPVPLLVERPAPQEIDEKEKDWWGVEKGRGP